MVIKAEKIYKEYRLGVINHGTLYRDIQALVARLRGKPDPNLPLHARQRVIGDHFYALRDVSFEVREGEVLGIIGRNGAGKSTLLKILSRITAPSRGSVSIRGRMASLLEVGTGFHPELTGRENIFLNGAILGMNRREILRKLDEIIDFSGVDAHIDTPVKRYSSGMYVRLAFSVAAFLEPDILVVDEVLAVGDAEFQKKCLGKMKDVSAQSGRTVLFVSHSLEAIRRICTQGMLLEAGQLVHFGSIDSTINAYKNSIKSFSDFGEAGMTDRLNRTNGFVQMQSIRAFTNSGKNTWTFMHGEDINMEIDYHVKQKANGLGFYLALINPDTGQMVTNMKEVISKKTLDPGTRGRIGVRLPKNILRPKYYKLYMTVSDKSFGHAYDVVDDNVALPELEIVARNVDPHFSVGFFSMDYRIKGVKVL
jgi:lipopolysaccharide transport system ATP-binding protein